MFGTFQHSNLRIEVDASATTIRNSLVMPTQFKQWVWPQQFSEGLPDTLDPGLTFSSFLGPVRIYHRVDELTESHLRFVLWQGIDGFHEWHWGEGWLQSRIEGVSLLPLNMGQTLSLWRLRQFLATQSLS